MEMIWVFLGFFCFFLQDLSPEPGTEPGHSRKSPES